MFQQMQAMAQKQVFITFNFIQVLKITLLWPWHMAPCLKMKHQINVAKANTILIMNSNMEHTSSTLTSQIKNTYKIILFTSTLLLTPRIPLLVFRFFAFKVERFLVYSCRSWVLLDKSHGLSFLCFVMVPHLLGNDDCNMIIRHRYCNRLAKTTRSLRLQGTIDQDLLNVQKVKIFRAKWTIFSKANTFRNFSFLI